MHASCSCTHALADDRPAELETPQPHAPHIQPRAARSKQKNILSWSTIVARTEYSVVCTPPTWCWCTRKQEEKKRKEAKLQTSMHALCGVQATLTAAHAMRARAALSSCTGAKRHGHACLIDVHACECWLPVLYMMMIAVSSSPR